MQLGLGLGNVAWLLRAEQIGKSLEEAVGEEKGARKRKVVVAVEGLEWGARGEGGGRGQRGLAELRRRGRNALVCLGVHNGQ